MATFTCLYAGWMQRCADRVDDRSLILAVRIPGAGPGDAS